MNKDLIRNCPICNKELYYKDIYIRNKAEQNKGLCAHCANKNRYKKTNFIRYCPQCNKEIYYRNSAGLERALKRNKLCLGCSISNGHKSEKSFIRHCPKCNAEILYKTEYNKNAADSKQTLCGKCTRKITFSNPALIEKFKQLSTGSNNAMYGKSTYDVWLQKYGKEEADRRKQNMIEKCRIASSGKNNPMYGKPSPRGSGNGWSGHYKGRYFRSLLELYYLIYLIDNNIKFENGELKKHSIKYVINNTNRTYSPDYYLIDTDITVEIKPKKLINSYANKLKFEAARNKLGNKHVILTEDNITTIELDRLWSLYVDKQLVFDNRYIERFENYYHNHKYKQL